MSDGQREGASPCCGATGCLLDPKAMIESRGTTETPIRDADQLANPCAADRCAWCDCKECLWRTQQESAREYREWRRKQDEKEKEGRLSIERSLLLRRCSECGISRSENPSMPPCDCICW